MRRFGNKRWGWKPNLICHVHASSFQIDSTFSFWAAFPRGVACSCRARWSFGSSLPENCCCVCFSTTSSTSSLLLSLVLSLFVCSLCCWNAVLNLITPLLSAGRLSAKPLSALSLTQRAATCSLILLAGRVLSKFNTYIYTDLLWAHIADLFSRP